MIGTPEMGENVVMRGAMLRNARMSCQQSKLLHVTFFFDPKHVEKSEGKKVVNLARFAQLLWPGMTSR